MSALASAQAAGARFSSVFPQHLRGAPPAVLGLGVCGGQCPAGQRRAVVFTVHQVAGRSAIKHNAGDYAKLAAWPGISFLAAGCGSYRIICVMSCAPAVSRPGVTRHSQAPAAVGGGVPSAITPHQLSAFGLRLKSSCPPGCVCPSRLAVAGSLLVPVLASFRTHPGSVWSCKINPGSGRRATERRCGPCGPRQPTPGRRPCSGPPKDAAPCMAPGTKPPHR